MAKLDLIVIHHDEVWRDGKKLFDSIAMQRSVRFDDINVIIVQSGDKQLAWDNIINRYPYRITVVKSPMPGLSNARNVGIRSAKSDWLMFCDFDDAFADVYSLHAITDLLPVTSFDVLWMPIYYETLYNAGRDVFIGIVKDNQQYIHGKMFRKQFLTDHNLSFNPDLHLDAADAFCADVSAHLLNSRYGTITTEFIPYVHTYRPGSESSKPENNNLQNIFTRDQAIIASAQSQGNARATINAIIRLYCDAYYLLAHPALPDDRKPLLTQFIEINKKYATIFLHQPKADVEVIADSSLNESIHIAQDRFNRFGIESPIIDRGVSIQDWVKSLPTTPQLRKLPGKRTEPAQTVVSLPIATVSNPRVAVYCGTRNVYDNMEISAKSLVAHTRMDKIYFLIEDDEFPSALPPYIETINVSRYKDIFKNSPNFKSMWTYMCMVRSDFASIVPESVVLSLDIDTIIQDDISELFNIDMEGYYLAGVTEKDRAAREGKPYINFGVVLMNLQLLRESGKGKEVMDALQNNKYGAPEQDAFNYTCCDKILVLPTMYNVCRYGHVTGEDDHEKISHYAGIHYWRGFESVRQYSGLSWDDVERERVKRFAGVGNGNENEDENEQSGTDADNGNGNDIGNGNDKNENENKNEGNDTLETNGNG